MAAIPYLAGGESVEHSHLNVLFAELDRKLAAVCDGKSMLLLRDRTRSMERLPTRFFGKLFCFLSPSNQVDQARAGLPPYCFSSVLYGLARYRNYNHTPFTQAAAQTPIWPSRPVGSGEPRHHFADAEKKLLRIIQPHGGFYATAGVDTADDLFDYSLEAHRRTYAPAGAGATATATIDGNGVVTGLTLTAGGAGYLTPPRMTFTDGVTGDPVAVTAHCYIDPPTGAVVLLVLDSGGSGGLTVAPVVTFAQVEAGTSEPYWLMSARPGATPGAELFTVQCPLRYQQAELVFDDGRMVVTIPANYDRFNFFRLHNLQPFAITVEFSDSTGVVAHQISVPALGSKCLRRDVDTSGNTVYTRGFDHFQRFISGDPRYYSKELPDGMNNIVNPSLAMIWVQTLVANKFAELDTRQFWDASAIYCDGNYPQPGSVDWTKWINGRAGMGSGYFEPVADGTMIGDLLHHKGKICAVGTPVTVTTDHSFTMDDHAHLYMLRFEPTFTPLGLEDVSVGGNSLYGVGYTKVRATVSGLPPGAIPTHASFFGVAGNPAGDGMLAFNFPPGGPVNIGDTVRIQVSYLTPRPRTVFDFTGYGNLVSNFAARGFTATPVPGTGVQLSGADFIGVSTNLIYSGCRTFDHYIPGPFQPGIFVPGNSPALVRSGAMVNDIEVPELATGNEAVLSQGSADYYDLPYTPGDNPVTITFDNYGVAALPANSDPRMLEVMSSTVGDLKGLRPLGIPDSGATYPLTEYPSNSAPNPSKLVMLTGFGPVFTFTREEAQQVPVGGWDTLYRATGFGTPQSINSEIKLVTVKAFHLGADVWPLFQSIEDWIAERALSGSGSVSTDSVNWFGDGFGGVDDVGWTLVSGRLIQRRVYRDPTGAIIPEWHPGMFLSPRVTMVYGKRRFYGTTGKVLDVQWVNGVASYYENPNGAKLPRAARMWHGGFCTPAFSGLGVFNPDVVMPEFSTVAEEARLRARMGAAFTKPGFAFLKPLEDVTVLTGLSFWFNRMEETIITPGGRNYLDFRGENSWYDVNADRVAAGTVSNEDGDVGRFDGLGFWTGYHMFFERMPLLVDHYNNLASLVNGMTAVRPLDFQTFYGDYSNSYGAIGKWHAGSPATISFGSVRPAACFGCVERSDPNGGAALVTPLRFLATALGITVKTRGDLLGNYGLLTDTSKCLRVTWAVDSSWAINADGWQPTSNIAMMTPPFQVGEIATNIAGTDTLGAVTYGVADYQRNTTAPPAQPVMVDVPNYELAGFGKGSLGDPDDLTFDWLDIADVQTAVESWHGGLFKFRHVSRGVPCSLDIPTVTTARNVVQANGAASVGNGLDGGTATMTISPPVEWDDNLDGTLADAAGLEAFRARATAVILASGTLSYSPPANPASHSATWDIPNTVQMVPDASGYWIAEPSDFASARPIVATMQYPPTPYATDPGLLAFGSFPFGGGAVSPAGNFVIEEGWLSAAARATPKTSFTRHIKAMLTRNYQTSGDEFPVKLIIIPCSTVVFPSTQSAAIAIERAVPTSPAIPGPVVPFTAANRTPTAATLETVPDGNQSFTTPGWYRLHIDNMVAV